MSVYHPQKYLIMLMFYQNAKVFKSGELSHK